MVPPDVTNVRVPDCAPMAVGVNVTFAVQLAPTARLAAHDVEAANGPDAVTDVMLTATFPELDNWTLCAVEVVETFWLPKLSEPTFVLSDVCSPVPLSDTT